MNINLQQLKEITKAGYGIPDLNEDCVYMMAKKNDVGWIKLYMGSKELLMIDFISLNFKPMNGLVFNEFAAILKMEELGLIEK